METIVMVMVMNGDHKWILVGGIPIPLKNTSQLGWLFPIYIYNYIYIVLSGNSLHFANLKMAPVEIVDLSIHDGNCPQLVMMAIYSWFTHHENLHL